MRNKKSIEYKGDWSENIFKGKIFCGYCGKNLHRQKKTQKIYEDYYFFNCISNYRIHKGYCQSGKRIKEESISQTVLNIIEKQSTAIFGMSLSMKKQSRDIEKRLKSQNNELSLIAKEIDKHRKYLKSLYEHLASGIIDVTEYKVLKQGYEEKIETDRQHYFDLEMQVKELQMQISSLKSLDENLKSVNKNAFLTREIIEHLIEKIVVFDEDNIEITFKFSNNFPLLREVLGDE